MSSETDFLARWSRRKHQAATDEIRQSKSVGAPDDIVSGALAPVAQGESRPPFDPASLPTIDSIGADTSIRAFLEAGVPGDLARAALRRAWSSDPAIRDFVGLSENSWDFNASGAMAGFGPIDGEEVGRLLTRLLGEPDTIAAEAHLHVEDSQKPAGESDPVECQATNTESVALVSARSQQLDFDEIDVADDVTQLGSATAPQSELTPSERLSPTFRRGHGGALPRLRYAGSPTPVCEEGDGQ
jgi:hypothetical protein